MPRFRPRSDLAYLAFNKPWGVMSQFSRAKGTDKSTLADFAFPADVYPVGRLDAESEGLIILSDDPALTEALLNPQHGHCRTYLAQVERVPTAEALAALAKGVRLDGRLTLPALARLIDGEPDVPPRAVPIRFRKNVPTAWIELSLMEGRNRQVRRMTAAVGFPTLRLVRVAIGALTLSALKLEPGTWRRLSHREVLLAFALTASQSD